MALGPGDHDQTCMVTLNMSCKSQDEAVQALETVSRTAIGLALDGIHANISIAILDPPEEGWGN